MDVEATNLYFIKKFKNVEVPYFQRPYVWNEENWERLREELINNDESHFLGTIIIESKKVEHDDLKAEVIDGQQRLTTLSILFIALCNVKLKNCNSEDKVLFNAVKNRIIGKDTPILTLSYNDSKYYKNIFNESVDIKEIYSDEEAKSENKIRRKKNKKEKQNLPFVEESNNIYRCYKYFYTYFENKKNKNEVNKIWNYIYNETYDEHVNPLFAKISLDENEDSQKIFDCINSAGVRLSESDIIKNNIFAVAKELLKKEKKDCELTLVKLYENTWKCIFESESDEKRWRKAISTGRIERDNLELFLDAFASIKEIIKNGDKLENLSKAYKAYFNKKIKKYDDMTEFLNELKVYAEIYKKHILYFEKTDEYEYSDCIKRILLVVNELDYKTTYSYILKELYNHTNRKTYEIEGFTELEKEFNLLEKFLIRVNVCKDDATKKDFNNQFQNITTGKQSLYEYIEKRKNNSQSDLSNERFNSGLLYLKHDNVPRLILFVYELKYRNENKSFQGTEKQLKYEYTLEHIMPQSYTKYWNFDAVKQEYDKKYNDYKDLRQEEIRKNSIYEIGNMLLLHGLKNSYNSDLPMKGNDGKNKWNVLKSNGKELATHDIFIKIYKKENKWNEKFIRMRTNILIKEMDKYYKI